MRKTLLGGLGILALDLFLAISGAFSVAVPSASAATHHKVTKSYLMDQQGTVASPAAGNPYAGEALNQMTTGAWQIKFVPQWGGLCLVNSSSWCVRDASGIPKMIQVSVPIHKSWVWSEHVRTSGGINFQNADGGYLCALGGSGNSDEVVPKLSDCPGGSQYDRWFFNGTTAKGGIHTTALVVGHPPVPVSNAGHLRRTSTFDQQDEQFGDCQRDPSSGGLGTVVVNSSCGSSNAMDWSYQANGHCGGQVTKTCPGGHISASPALIGDFIITVRNIGQGSLCEGADAQTNWTMQMFTCDGVGGQNHLNNLFIWSQTAFCGNVGGNDLISYQWNANGLDGTGNVYNPGGTGSNVEVTQVPPACQEALWRLNGS